MSDTIIRRGFPFSIGTLLSDAQRLLGALNDGTLAPPMVDHLSAAFVTDFTAQLALVAKLSNNQSTATGLVNALTFAQSGAQRDFSLLASSARRAARLAFPGQDALLHSEFQVGIALPRTLADTINRGEKLVTAWQTHATDLSSQGWLPASTDKLKAALDALTGGGDTHQAAKGGKIGLTTDCIAAANTLYRQCVAVQNAARVVFAKSNVASESGTAEARERFLLRQFPPRKRSATTTPVVVTPTGPSGSAGSTESAVPVTPVHLAPVSTVAAQEVPKAA
jgi:hypothetical protein